MNDRTDRARIEDVAAAAGVSAATVSRALRGLPNVAASTRQRIEQIAARLEYRPDPNASRLAAGRSGAVAVAVPMVNTWYFSEVIAGAEAVFAEAGYDVLISSIAGPNRRALFLSEIAFHRRADGVVMVDLAMEQAERDVLLRAGVPAVTTGIDTGDFPSVVVDNERIGRLAAEHLVGLGHRRIALIEGDRDGPLPFPAPTARRRGFDRAIEERGLETDPRLREIGAFSVDGGREAMQSLLKTPDRPTAVFAISDEMAFGAMQAARASGLRIPDDLSIMGVDDHHLAESFGLTTVRQGVEQHGPVAARQLLAVLGGQQPEERLVALPVAIVQRHSTAAPPTNMSEL